MLQMITTAVFALILSSPAFAAEKTYQVTGPVLDVTDTTITIDKAGDKWEIAKDAAATVHGDLKKGAKVTIKYKMIATDVEVKGDSAAKKK